MDRTEKANALIERAEKLGIRLECDGVFLVANQAPTGERERQDEIIAALTLYLREVHFLVKRRSLAAHAKAFLGLRVCFPDGFTLSERGEGVISGVIVGASHDDLVDVSIEKEGSPRPQVTTAKVENLLFIRDEEEAASAHNDEPKSEQPRRGFFDRLRGSREE